MVRWANRRHPIAQRAYLTWRKYVPTDKGKGRRRLSTQLRFSTNRKDCEFGSSKCPSIRNMAQMSVIDLYRHQPHLSTELCRPCVFTRFCFLKSRTTNWTKHLKIDITQLHSFRKIDNEQCLELESACHCSKLIQNFLEPLVSTKVIMVHHAMLQALLLVHPTMNMHHTKCVLQVNLG
jgi:hypothetical protein